MTVTFDNKAFETKFELDTWKSPPGEYGFTFESYNTLVNYNTALKVDTITVKVLPRPLSLSQSLSTKTLTVGNFVKWNLPKATIGTYGLNEYRVRSSEDLEPYIDYDEDSKTVTYSGSIES